MFFCYLFSYDCLLESLFIIAVSLKFCVESRRKGLRFKGPTYFVPFRQPLVIGMSEYSEDFSPRPKWRRLARRDSGESDSCPVAVRPFRRQRSESSRRDPRVLATETPSPEREVVLVQREKAPPSTPAFPQSLRRSPRTPRLERSRSPRVQRPLEPAAVALEGYSAPRESRLAEGGSKRGRSRLGDCQGRRAQSAPDVRESRPAASISRPSKVRAQSTPPTTKVCTICDEDLLPSDETLKWYNEHKQCGLAKRALDRQLRANEDLRSIYFYNSIFSILF